MEKHAVVRGEVHVSKIDRKALFNRDLNDYEIVYMEGRSDTIHFHKNTVSYILYLIGILSLELLYRISEIIQSNREKNGYNIRQEAKKRGLKFENEIDLEAHEIYEKYDTKLRSWLPIGFSLLLLMLIVATFFNDTVAFLGINIGIPYWFAPLVVAIISPLAYLSLLEATSGIDRDREMVTQIDLYEENRRKEEGISSDNQGILVLVGDDHVTTICDELESKGWNVTSERSDHWLARFKRWLIE